MKPATRLYVHSSHRTPQKAHLALCVFASWDSSRAVHIMLRDRRSGKELTPGKPHEIAGERFHGTITVFKDDKLLENHGLQAHVCICGEFLKETPASQCYTGQAFDRPVNLPRSKLVAKLGYKLLRRWSPSLSFDTGSRPHFLAPLLGAASRYVQYTDTERLPCTPEPPHDDRLMEELAEHIPAGHRARRSYFSKASMSEPGVVFRPGEQHSFHFIVEKLDLDTLKLCGLPRPFDIPLDKHLGGQPLRLLGVWCGPSPAPPPSGEPLWDVEIWSRRQCAEGIAAAASSGAAEQGCSDAQNGDLHCQP